MDKSILKEIIAEQAEAISKKDRGIGRESLNKVKEYLDLPQGIVISGIRRVGKSTLLTQIMDNFYEGSTYYLNFEDERLLNFEVSDFNHLYELFVELFGQQRVFFFDEIQNVNGWEMFVRRMIDRGFKFFLTGSNASLLSKELGTKLTGRHLSIELYPFSFKEFLRFKGYGITEKSLLLTEERARIKRFFNEYLLEGGMPEHVRYKDADILKKVYDDIIYRDIVARYDIKGVKSLRELALYFLSNPGTLFSYNKLKGFLGLGSVNTAKNYVEYLENSFIIFTINSFAYSLKQQVMAPKKVYCLDTGLARAISFKFSRNRGRFLENLVFIELKRRGEEVYYYKTGKSFEVDFLIKKGPGIEHLIQVSQSLSAPEVRERELRALVSGLEELNLPKGLILTEDEEEEIEVGNKRVSIRPVYKWLLE